MQRNAMIEAGFVVLEKAGIANNISRGLLEDHPHCGELLQIMDNAGLFTNSRNENKTLFANLIHVSKYLSENDPANAKPKKDNIDSLLKVYRLLAGNNDKPCLLTASIHKTITTIILHSDDLGSSSDLLVTLQPINQDVVNRFFSAPANYINLFHLTHQFDHTNESFLHLFNTVTNVAKISELDECLTIYLMLDRNKKQTWLNKERFKIIVDNIVTFDSIIRGFRDLNQVNMIDDYCGRLLQNPKELASTLSALNYNQLLTINNVPFAFDNPKFSTAVRLCEKLGFIGWGGKVGDKSIFLTRLLKNVELTQAICLLNNIVEKHERENRRDSLDECKKDLQWLIDSSRILAEPAKSTFAGNVIKFFSGRKQEVQVNLDTCVSTLKAKYDIKDEPVAAVNNR